MCSLEHCAIQLRSSVGRRPSSNQTNLHFSSSIDYQLVHRDSVCRFFSTSFRTSCSVRPSSFSTLILRHVDTARPSSSSTPALRYIVTNFFLGPSSSVQHVDSTARRDSSSVFDQCVSSSLHGQRDCNMARPADSVIRRRYSWAE